MRQRWGGAGGVETQREGELRRGEGGVETKREEEMGGDKRGGGVET